MEEMQNLNVEETVTEMVEVATDKLTFKENCVAYVLAGVFVTGLTTIGYLGYKGTKKLANKIRDKKISIVEVEIPVENVEDSYEHENNEEDSE